jgi:hypothetical protein
MEITCVSCEVALSESDPQHQQHGDTYCEGCWYEEEGVIA